MITNPSSIDKSILKYEAIGKGMKLAKQIELSVYIIQAIRYVYINDRLLSLEMSIVISHLDSMLM